MQVASVHHEYGRLTLATAKLVTHSLVHKSWSFRAVIMSAVTDYINKMSA